MLEKIKEEKRLKELHNNWGQVIEKQTNRLLVE